MKDVRVTIALEGIIRVPDDMTAEEIRDKLEFLGKPELSDERCSVGQFEYFVAHMEAARKKLSTLDCLVKN